MDNVRNKTVLVTGGASGLGYKFAEILLRNGAKSVAIVDLPTSSGEDAASTFQKEFGKDRAIFVACDATKAENLEKAFKRIIDAFGTLDILINNAGIFDEKFNKWERTIDLNVTALIRSSYLALDHMGKYKSGKGGVIVNISSIFGLVPYPPGPVYTASKHAVLGFSQSLAGLYDRTGVRVLVMCPGGTKTSIAKDFTKKIIDFVDEECAHEFGRFTFQSTDNVARAMLDLIQKGKTGAVWVSDLEEPPYAVDFLHYSKRSLPV